MTRYQWIIYISEAPVLSGGHRGLAADLNLALWWRSPAPPSEYNIEYRFEPGEAGLYVYLECQDLLVAGRVAKSVVKILNRIAAGARGSRDFRYEDLVTDRFVFEDAQISVIKDGE
jgi:hypothetical protein